ncbi:hypothetical protein CONPUDRAFT_164234 [Coniophora puteana RWD-64-598 SS2]|uniref:Uncharacterized protein n=1 Tax=Coniophora puteana (strain RWD-64-598) TaxID=741705 RepID=A0A5M3MW91_CONPW|nr:uncharacterized protein CONPUDRAFT_164234 [Coniophora puteana RWD-64-598 SS2]EIW83257.1 hypothetical protein CONPUDRAFT_164234 [Coniophora puteana RWD-64-598 SS2]
MRDGFGLTGLSTRIWKLIALPPRLTVPRWPGGISELWLQLYRCLYSKIGLSRNSNESHVQTFMFVTYRDDHLYCPTQLTLSRASDHSVYPQRAP